MSRRRTLYTRVLFLMTSILLGIFAFIVYVMPSKITITLSYRVNNVAGREVTNIKLSKSDQEPKIDANKPLTQSNFFNNINNHDKFVNIFGYEFKGWKINNSLDLTAETTFNKSTTIYGILTPYRYRVYLDFSDQTNADATNHFKPEDLGFMKEGRKYVKDLTFGDELILPSAKNTEGEYLFVDGNLNTDGRVLSGWYSTLGTKDEDFEQGEDLTESIIEYEHIFKINQDYNPENSNDYYGSFTFKPLFIDRKVNINFKYGLTTDELLNDDKVHSVEISRGKIPENEVFITPTTDLSFLGEEYKHKEFLGWHETELDSAGNPIVDTNGNIVLKPVAYDFTTPFYVDDISLYAQYDNKTYTMTFDLNIPTSITETSDIEEIHAFNKRFVDENEYKYQSKKYDETGVSNKLLEINPPPFITGFRFDGWYRVQMGVNGEFLNPDNSGESLEKFDFENDVVDKDFTLYAKWGIDTSENNVGDISRFQTTTKNVNGETIAVITGMHKHIPFNPYVIIPLEDKDGNPIREIQNRAFRFYEIEAIVISRNIRVIHDGAFSFDENSSVDLLPRIKEIIVSTQNENYRDIDGMLFDKLGKKLIYYPAAKSAENLIIGREGDAVNEIGAWAFKDAYNLESVEINVSTIGDFAFRNTIRSTQKTSSKLVNVTLKEKIVNIGKGVFAGNDKLLDFTVQNNARITYNVSNKALMVTGAGITRILHIIESHSPTSILPIGNASNSYIIDSYAFAYSKVKNLKFTNVREINAEAFFSSNIQSIKFVNSSLNLSRIDAGAFANMNSLVEIDFKDSINMVAFNLNIFGDTMDPSFKIPQQIYLPSDANAINLGNISSIAPAKFANVTFYANSVAAQKLRNDYADLNLTVEEYN